MGFSIGKLYVDLVANTGELDKSLAQAKSNSAKTASEIEAHWKKTGSSLSSVGKEIGTALAGLGLAKVGKDMIETALKAEEAGHRFDAAFGSMTSQAEGWAESLSKSLGVSKYALKSMSSEFQSMFRGMGLNNRQAANFSETMSELSQNMAAYWQIDPSEAEAKLRSALTGRGKALKQLGIIVDDASAKDYAYRHNIGTLGTELTNSQLVMARYNLIMEQTANMSGYLAKMAGEPADDVRRMREGFADASVNLGKAFLPVVEKVVPELGKLADFLKEIDPDKAFSVVKWAVAIAALTKVASLAKDIAAAGSGIRGLLGAPGGGGSPVGGGGGSVAQYAGAEFTGDMLLQGGLHKARTRKARDPYKGYNYQQVSEDVLDDGTVVPNMAWAKATKKGDLIQATPELVQEFDKIHEAEAFGENALESGGAASRGLGSRLANTTLKDVGEGVRGGASSIGSGIANGATAAALFAKSMVVPTEIGLGATAGETMGGLTLGGLASAIPAGVAGAEGLDWLLGTMTNQTGTDSSGITKRLGNGGWLPNFSPVRAFSMWQSKNEAEDQLAKSEELLKARQAEFQKGYASAPTRKDVEASLKKDPRWGQLNDQQRRGWLSSEYKSRRHQWFLTDSPAAKEKAAADAQARAAKAEKDAELQKQVDSINQETGMSRLGKVQHIERERDIEMKKYQGSDPMMIKMRTAIWDSYADKIKAAQKEITDAETKGNREAYTTKLQLMGKTYEAMKAVAAGAYKDEMKELDALAAKGEDVSKRRLAADKRYYAEKVRIAEEAKKAEFDAKEGVYAAQDSYNQGTVGARWDPAIRGYARKSIMDKVQGKDYDSQKSSLLSGYYGELAGLDRDWNQQEAEKQRLTREYNHKKGLSGTKPEELSAIAIQISDINRKQGDTIPKAQDAWYKMYGGWTDIEKGQKEAGNSIMERIYGSLKTGLGEKDSQFSDIEMSAKKMKKEIWSTLTDPRDIGLALSGIDADTEYQKKKILEESKPNLNVGFTDAQSLWKEAMVSGLQPPKVEIKLAQDQLAVLRQIESHMAASSAANQSTAGSIKDAIGLG